MFKVGSRYLAQDFIRHRPWWGSEEGYEIFKDREGYLYTVDGDGDEGDVKYLDSSAEVVHSLENE